MGLHVHKIVAASGAFPSLDQPNPLSFFLRQQRRMPLWCGWTLLSSPRLLSSVPMTVTTRTTKTTRVTDDTHRTVLLFSLFSPIPHPSSPSRRSCFSQRSSYIYILLILLSLCLGIGVQQQQLYVERTHAFPGMVCLLHFLLSPSHILNPNEPNRKDNCLLLKELMHLNMSWRMVNNLLALL